MTPRYTVGVWVGNDMKTVSLGPGMEGARVALPIWMRILEKMRDARPDRPERRFRARRPTSSLTPVDYETGLKATPGDPHPILETFLSGSQPTEEWSARWGEITQPALVASGVLLRPEEGRAAEVGVARRSAPTSPDAH